MHVLRFMATVTGPSLLHHYASYQQSRDAINHTTAQLPGTDQICHYHNSIITLTVSGPCMCWNGGISHSAISIHCTGLQYTMHQADRSVSQSQYLTQDNTAGVHEIIARKHIMACSMA